MGQRMIKIKGMGGEGKRGRWVGGLRLRLGTGMGNNCVLEWG